MRKESIVTFVIFLCVYSNVLASAIYVDKGGGSRGIYVAKFKYGNVLI